MPKLMVSKATASVAAVLIGLFLTGAPTAASAREACRVQFSEVALEPYQSGGRTLYRLRIRGEHNFDPATRTGGTARTRFDVTDGDGFFSIAVLTARWRGASAGDAASRTVRVPRAEMESLRRATEVGQAYYARVGEIISTPPRPANYDAMMEQIGPKTRVLAELQILGDETEGDRADEIETFNFLTWLQVQMARFRSHDGGDLMSAYRDNLIEGAPPNTLCDPAAVSAIVGVLACPAPAPGARGGSGRNPVCPDGLTFSSLVIPALPNATPG